MNRSIAPAHLLFAIFFIAGLAWLAQMPVSPQDADAPSDRFSAGRAMEHMADLLPENIPHPSGSEENGRTLNRLLGEFQSLGIEPRTETRTTCSGFRSRGQFIGCIDVTNVIAPINGDPSTDSETKPVVLMAHYDSVGASPGAGDDLSGVSIILEVARILKAEGPFRNPIVALITDGEEDGLFGAHAHFTDENHVAQTGVVINMESRGNHGPSLMFETSNDGAWLVDLVASSGGRLITNSLMQAAYKQLPNDTDLTEALAAGLPGINFAFAKNVAHYHTPLDSRENLSRASLQHQGDNVLNAARALADADLSNPPNGEAIYIDILSLYVLRIPSGMALPLSLLAVGLIGFAAWTSGKNVPRRWPALAVGVLLVPLMLASAAASGFAIDFIAGLFGEPSPGYASPLSLRLALYGGVAAAMLALSLAIGRWLGTVICLFSVWGAYAVFSTVAAMVLPGASVVFLFPAVVAAVLVAMHAVQKTRGGSTASPEVLHTAAAIVLMVLLFPAVGLFEVMFGLRAHFLVTVPLALALMGCVPLVVGWREGDFKLSWRVTGGLAAGSVALAVVAGLTPSYDAWRPLRMNIEHFTDSRVESDQAGAQWRLSSWDAADVPEAFNAVAEFSDNRQQGPISFMRRAYVAPAPAGAHPTPTVSVGEIVRGDDVHQIRLRFEATADMRGILIEIPNAVRPLGVSYANQVVTADFAPSEDPEGVKRYFCIASACRDLTVTLDSGGDMSLPWKVYTVQRGLPDLAATLVAARPEWTVPVQAGDVTTSLRDLKLR